MRRTQSARNQTFMCVLFYFQLRVNSPVSNFRFLFFRRKTRLIWKQYIAFRLTTYNGVYSELLKRRRIRLYTRIKYVIVREKQRVRRKSSK